MELYKYMHYAPLLISLTFLPNIQCVLY